MDSSDPISQAIAIARSAACDEIDWGSEPFTDRERRVRAKYLDHIVGDEETKTALGAIRLGATIRARRLLGQPIASDLQAASDRANTIAELYHVVRETERLREACEAADTLEDGFQEDH